MDISANFSSSKAGAEMFACCWGCGGWYTDLAPLTIPLRIFRKDNADPFKSILNVLLLSGAKNFWYGKVMAVDGTKIRVQNNKKNRHSMRKKRIYLRAKNNISQVTESYENTTCAMYRKTGRHRNWKRRMFQKKMEALKRASKSIMHRRLKRCNDSKLAKSKLVCLTLKAAPAFH